MQRTGRSMDSAKDKNTAPCKWWLDMTKADAERVNRVAETARKNHFAERISFGECPQVVSLSEFRGVLETGKKIQQRKYLLDECGVYQGSNGELVKQEEYTGQKSAYRSCSNIIDYLGRLEQLDLRAEQSRRVDKNSIEKTELLTILRYGFMKKKLTFFTEATGSAHYCGDATCFDFSVDTVTPYLSRDMHVKIDVGITTDIYYMHVTAALAFDEAGVPKIREVFQPRKTQCKYCAEVIFNAHDGSLSLESIMRPDAPCADAVDENNASSERLEKSCR